MHSSIADERRRGSRKILISYGHTRNSVSVLATRSQRPEEETASDEVEVPGLIGILDLISSSHLIAITRQEQVAQIQGKGIFAVRDVALISLEGRKEAENGIAVVRKTVVGQESEKQDGDTGGKSDGAEVEGADLELTDDEEDAHEEAVEAAGESHDRKPGQGLLGKGAGVARGVVTSPVKVGRFAGRWFARGSTAKQKQSSLGESQQSVESKTSDQTVAKAASAESNVENSKKPQEPQNEASSSATDAEQGKEKRNHGETVMESLTPRILKGARLYFSQSGFFFSYEHDLSGSLTQKSDAKDTATPLWKRFDSIFFWNRHLLGSFIEAGLDELALPLLQGFVGQRAFSVEKTDPEENDFVADASQDPGEVIAMQAIPAPNVEISEKKAEAHEFLLTLISRRSNQRAGLRYRRRGIDDHGHVANFVETEQILSSPSWAPSSPASSLIQIRGSIPLFFNQSPYSFKPQPIPFGSETVNHAAFVKHFEALQKRYGEVQIASLVDKSATEVGIGELYGKHVQMANNGLGIGGKQIGFEWFDFHAQCKGMRFENVSLLMDKLEKKLDSFGWVVKKDGRSTQLQKGVVRVNCMDCLDRTNVVQSAIAGWALEKQLASLGLNIDLKADSRTQWFNTLWADNGDYISKQYAGTAALKGDFTRTRRRNWTGALSDFSLTLTRYYNNVFGDYFMQACIDYYLGNAGSKVFEEFEADMMSQDYALDMRRVRQNGIETCVKIVLEDAHEELKAGWTLSCPKDSNTLRTLPFEECVLLLTHTDLFFCRFDWNTEKVSLFERIDLRDVVAMWRGAYVTSGLGEVHLDEQRNVGFVLRYKSANGRGIVRRNTRTFGNEEATENASLSENCNVDGEQASKEETSRISNEDETRLLAFKAVPPQASASQGATRAADQMSEVEIVEHICAEIYKIMAPLRMQEGDKKEDVPGIEEKAVISAAEAKKATGYIESIGYGLKRMVWS